MSGTRNPSRTNPPDGVSGSPLGRSEPGHRTKPASDDLDSMGGDPDVQLFRSEPSRSLGESVPEGSEVDLAGWVKPTDHPDRQGLTCIGGFHPPDNRRTGLRE